MAQRVNIVLVDDIDGGDADETVTFGLDGTTYEIDLSSANAEKLRETLAPFVGHARRVAGGRRASGSSRRTTASTAGPSAKEIREWARENGWDLSDRGRVSAEVRQAYDAAH